MDTRTYGAYGYRVATTVDAAHTGYASEVAEIGLDWYLLGRRFFIPWLRRFISPDPGSPFGAGGLNRYAYCSGDPINRIDPSGNASFGWLSKLLGQLTGMAKTAAHAVATVTPTTALTALSRAAEVVSVSVGIGAVAAMALGDTQAAGVMGWVAAGTVGGGAAIHVIGKGARISPGKTLRYREGAQRISTSRTAPRPTRTAFAGEALYGPPHINNQTVAIHTDSAGQRVREIRTLYFERAQWHLYEHPDNPISLHVVADSLAITDELAAPLLRVRQANWQTHQITIYGNVHGYRNGLNTDDHGRWISHEPRMFESLASRNGPGPIFRPGQVEPYDLSQHSIDAYRQHMRQSGVHVHYYCYSAASQDIIEELRIPAASQVRMAPDPRISTFWYYREGNCMP